MASASVLSFGIVDGHPVFMDERSDSYFRLDDEAEEEFLEQVGPECVFPPSARPDLQIASGTFEFSAAVHARAPRPRQSLLDEPRSTVRAPIKDAVKVARLLRRARLAIARSPIAETLSAFSHQQAGEIPQSAEVEPRDRAARFAGARRLVPIAPNCLTDSLALVGWLGPSPGTLLVFGVKLDPFAAHCLEHAPAPLTASGLDMRTGHPAEAGDLLKRGSQASAPRFSAPHNCNNSKVPASANRSP